MLKTAIFILLLFVSPISLSESSIGVAGKYSQSLYKETDNKLNGLPMFSYKGERLYLQFPEIGYHFVPKNALYSLSAGLIYSFSPFNPDASDNRNIQLLDERDDNTMAFISYRLGPITTKLAQDINGVHDGYYGQLSLGYPLQLSSWKVIPSVSYRYISKQMSQHMFGVSQNESIDTAGGIPTYSSPSTSKISYGVTAINPITKSFSTILSIKQERYSKITESPIIEDDSISSLLVGIFYKF